MTAQDTYPQIRTVGLDGIIVTFAATMSEGATRASLAFRSEIERMGWPELQESASTLVSVFFRFDLVEHAPASLIARLEDALATKDWLSAPWPNVGRRWTIPAVFGGARAPQLGEVADLAGLSEAQARAELVASELRVLTLGFAPGTPYMAGLPPHWNVPRQTDLSRRVPKGALITAVQQVILFTKDSPTGWRHIGQTAFDGFQSNAAEPILLRPGDVMCLAEVSEAELARLETLGDPKGGAVCEPLA